MNLSAWKQRSLVAVAEKRLLVLPGDYVLFPLSGKRLLVTAALECQPKDNAARGEPTMGQQLLGLMWEPTKGSYLSEFWLDWSGFEDTWTIHRTKV